MPEGLWLIFVLIVSVLFIILGTIIGTIPGKSNAAIKLEELVLKLVGKRFPAPAMSIIGYIVSIPVFCDSA